MPTQFWSTVMDHRTDAAFRAWGLELNTKLAAAGLVQTSDTGQINWATVTRAGQNTDAGYEIWRFNDAMQSAAPIFLKIHYGTFASDADYPRLRLIVGSATDGAGTITTNATTVRTITAAAGIKTGVSNFPSYLCVAEGFLGLVWKSNGSVNLQYAWGGFMICRSCDTDGVPDDRGCFINYHSNSGSASSDCTSQSIRFTSTAIVYTQQSQTEPIFVPGNVTSSMVGSDFQAYLAWMINPQVLPVFGLCGVFPTELSLGNTFTVTLVGTTSRTYIQTELQIGQSTENAPCGLCMLWE